MCMRAYACVFHYFKKNLLIIDRSGNVYVCIVRNIVSSHQRNVQYFEVYLCNKAFNKICRRTLHNWRLFQIKILKGDKRGFHINYQRIFAFFFFIWQ